MNTAIAAAYIRVSTDEQTEYSPAAQLEDILSFAAARSITVPKEFIFTDEGISGRTAERRPAFIAMIKAARKKSNSISLILVHKYDRFSRKKDDQVLYKAMLKKDGIRVISVKEPIPEDDKFAVIYESMLEAMAEYYSLNLAEEVKKTMVKKAERGEYQTAAPFGYKNECKSLVVIPAEADIIRYIFDSFANRHAAVNAIAASLNDMGITTHRGGSFEGRTISYILNNPVYCGYTRWTPDGRTRRNFSNPSTITAKGCFEPIISEELFNKAQSRYKEIKNNRIPKSRPLSEGRHYMSGIVKCSACGKSLVIVRNFKKGGFFMQCGGYNHGICRTSHSISSSVIIPAILNAFESLPATDINFTVEKISGNTGKNRAEILTEKALDKLKRAKNAFLSGIDTLEEYSSTKENIEREIKEIQKNIVDKQDDVSNGYADYFISKSGCIADILTDENIAMDDKKEALRQIVKNMVFNKPEGTLSIFLRI